jgi:hypothetical protein
MQPPKGNISSANGNRQERIGAPPRGAGAKGAGAKANPAH